MIEKEENIMKQNDMEKIHEKLEQANLENNLSQIKIKGLEDGKYMVELENTKFRKEIQSLTQNLRQKDQQCQKYKEQYELLKEKLTNTEYKLTESQDKNSEFQKKLTRIQTTAFKKFFIFKSRINERDINIKRLDVDVVNLTNICKDNSNSIDNLNNIINDKENNINRLNTKLENIWNSFKYETITKDVDYFISNIKISVVEF